MDRIKKCRISGTERFGEFVKANLNSLLEDLRYYDFAFLSFPDENGMNISYREELSLDWLRMFLLNKFSEFEYKQGVRAFLLQKSCDSFMNLELSEVACLITKQLADWIIALSGVTDIVFHLDGNVTVYGDADSVAEADRLIEHFCEMYAPSHSAISVTSDKRTPSKNIPSSFANPMRTVDLSPSRSEVLNEIASQIGGECEISAIGNSNCTLRSVYSPRKPLIGPNTPSSFSRPITNLPVNRSMNMGMQVAPRSLYVSTAPSTHQIYPPVSIPQQSISSSSSTKPEKIHFFVRTADAPRLIGTRGCNKKKLEHMTGCHLVLHTESRDGNLFPVEVIGSSAHSCANAQAAIERFLANGILGSTVEPVSPRKREPAKQMLQLSPKKNRNPIDNQ